MLDSNLNWSTFQLGSFGFGSVNVSIPAGLTQYQTTIAYQNSDGSSLNVAVALDFNVQTGLLKGTFTSLDPLTGQAPTGMDDGFLPPNNSGGVGEGFVQYTIQPDSALATGTTIFQLATVIFDSNAVVPTNLATNTIDSGAPTSTVSALPAIENPPGFLVQWSGQDDTGGSGIANYSVYVSDNEGAFTIWQNQVTTTSASFAAVAGHTYDFYSVATDNVGNVQATPSGASNDLDPKSDHHGRHADRWNTGLGPGGDFHRDRDTRERQQ